MTDVESALATYNVSHQSKFTYSYITATLRCPLLPDCSYTFEYSFFQVSPEKKVVTDIILDWISASFYKKSRNFCISKYYFIFFLGNSPESKIPTKLTLVDIIVLYTIILKTSLKAIKPPTILKIESKKMLR